jgi:hypothetical protein
MAVRHGGEVFELGYRKDIRQHDGLVAIIDQGFVLSLVGSRHAARIYLRELAL